MISANRVRRLIGNVLIFLGLIAFLAGCSIFVQQQVAGQQLRAELQAAETATPVPAEPSITPSPTATAAASATAAPASPTPAPTATALPVPPITATPDLPARIVIPDLKLDGQVVEMGWTIVTTAAGPRSEWVIPKNAAGHHINSAALNEVGNVVISGHNNIEGKVFEAISLAWDERNKIVVDAFTDRSDILKGRKIQIYGTTGTVYVYAITDFIRLKDSGVSLEQRLQNARYMDPSPEPILTLVTCWPPWSNTHRLIVRARPVQP